MSIWVECFLLYVRIYILDLTRKADHLVGRYLNYTIHCIDADQEHTNDGHNCAYIGRESRVALVSQSDIRAEHVEACDRFRTTASLPFSWHLSNLLSLKNF